MPVIKEEEEASMLSRRLFAAGAAGAPVVLAGAARAEDQPADSTIDRIKNTKVLRIAALPGEAPYFNKDIASGNWSGMCIEMAKDIAGVFDAQVEYVESTYGNSVLDLQANKIDLAFSLNPTPKRALVIDFTHAFYLHGLWSGRRAFTPRTGATSAIPMSKWRSISARCTRSQHAALRRKRRSLR
jgi:polar amino acid transport system substrate-binding protein